MKKDENICYENVWEHQSINKSNYLKWKKHVSEYMELGHFWHVKKYKMEICYHINEYLCDVTNRNIWVYKSYLFPMTFG